MLIIQSVNQSIRLFQVKQTHSNRDSQRQTDRHKHTIHKRDKNIHNTSQSQRKYTRACQEEDFWYHTKHPKSSINPER